MMKKRQLGLVAIVLIVVGCQVPTASNVMERSLTLTWSTASKARTLLPSTYPTIATYALTMVQTTSGGNGPAAMVRTVARQAIAAAGASAGTRAVARVSGGGTTITQTGLTSTSFVVSNILPGTWSTTIFGYDSGGNEVAWGTTTVTVSTTGNNVASVPLAYDYLGNGVGSFTVNMDWSAYNGGSVYGATITLLDPSGTKIGPAAMTTSGNTATYTNSSATSGTWTAILSLAALTPSGGTTDVYAHTESIVVVNQGDTTGSLTLTAADFHPPTLYVSASGNNSYDGLSPSSSLQTITMALQNAWSGSTIYVAPGTYSSLETFPLNIPAGVTVIGDEASKGEATIIEGDGPVSGGSTYAAVQMGSGSTIAGFTIIDTQGKPDGNVHFCVTNLQQSNVTIRNNQITQGTGVTQNTVQAGIEIFTTETTGDQIVGNVVTQCAQGLLIDKTSGAVKVQGNTFSGNLEGVLDKSGLADIGGGAAGSTGNNIFQENIASSNYDIESLSFSTPTSATNNVWSTNASPTITSTNSTNFNLYAPNWTGTLANAFVTTGSSAGNVYYVSNLGSDKNSGTSSASPFATITYALSVAATSPGTTIYVAPGTYEANSPNPETFPLVIPPGVTLIGDEVGKGAGSATLISGAPPASPTPGFGPSNFYYPTVMMGSNSTISGFEISNTSSGAWNPGILVASTGVTVRNCTLSNMIYSYAIDVATGGVGTFSNDVVTYNAQGFMFDSSAGYSSVQNCQIEFNTTGAGGVVINSGALVDLGGGPAGSVGGNLFYNSGGSAVDIVNWVTGQTVFAEMNQWTAFNNPFFANNQGSGLYTLDNVTLENPGGRIDRTGGRQAPAL